MTWDELPQLQTGDTGFNRDRVTTIGKVRDWFVALGIRIAGQEEGEPPTFANHEWTVFLPITVLKIIDHKVVWVTVDYWIYEALWNGYRKNKLRERFERDGVDVMVYHHPDTTPYDMTRLLAGMKHLDGKPYGKLLIGAHGGDYGLTRAWQAFGGKGESRVFRWLYHRFVNHDEDVDYAVCSWASGYLWDVWVGKPFEKHYKYAQPDDHHDECRKSWTEMFVHVEGK